MKQKDSKTGQQHREAFIDFNEIAEHFKDINSMFILI